MDGKAPQSNQVLVHHDGWCDWEPFFLWSVSHCSMDTTWFPFDEQVCNLVYESWKYTAEEVKLTTDFKDRNITPIHGYDFEPNDLWELVGKTLFLVSTYRPM